MATLALAPLKMAVLTLTQVPTARPRPCRSFASRHRSGSPARHLTLTLTTHPTTHHSPINLDPHPQPSPSPSPYP
eukprot:scaffold6843_cov66-Phaeocystis_antarctica.AAC.5